MISDALRNEFKQAVKQAKTGDEVMNAFEDTYDAYIMAGYQRDKWEWVVRELNDLVHLYVPVKVKVEIEAIRQGVYA
jgi:hypothetical protein